MHTFDSFEVSPVVEFLDADGVSCCAFDTLADAELAADLDNGDAIIWTVYGRREGAAEALADVGSEAEAFAALFALSGIVGQSGQRFYSVSR